MIVTRGVYVISQISARAMYEAHRSLVSMALVGKGRACEMAGRLQDGDLRLLPAQGREDELYDQGKAYAATA